MSDLFYFLISQIMAHWFLSNLPRKILGVYLVTVSVATFCWGPAPLAFGIIGIIGLSIYFAITFGNYNSTFYAIIDEILIPELIDKRPFKEADHMKKDEILQEILHNVNNKVYGRMGVHYGYTDARDLLDHYNLKVKIFEQKILEKYKDMPAEEILGWDKVMLVAKNIQDEDLNVFYGNVVSSDLINKYGTKKPILAPENNSNQLGKDNNNEYELSNMKDTGKVSEMV